MSEKIYVSPGEIRQYIEDNKGDLKEYMHMVAENTEYGISIWLGLNEESEVSVFVDSDGGMLFDAAVSSFYDIEMGFRNIYDRYLTSKVLQYAIIPETDDDEDTESREDELFDAAKDFVTLVYDGSKDWVYDEDEIRQFMESALDYLARYVNSSIKRPLHFDDGNTVSCEAYPYECMTFTKTN